MDLRKTLLIISAVCLVFMMVYLTFLRAKKPVHKPEAKAAATATIDAAATAEIEEANPDCPEYDKAFVKTARTIRTSAVWENKGAPYVVIGDITVAKTATITIKPGVIIKLKGKDTDFIIKGKLVSKGTKENPVIFTSLKDDIGGDTNCDSGASKPVAGDYGKVSVTGKKTGVIEIRYAEQQ